MMKLIKAVLVLAVLGVIGLTGFAYLANEPRSALLKNFRWQVEPFKMVDPLAVSLPRITWFCSKGAGSRESVQIR